MEEEAERRGESEQGTVREHESRRRGQRPSQCRQLQLQLQGRMSAHAAYLGVRRILVQLEPWQPSCELRHLHPHRSRTGIHVNNNNRRNRARKRKRKRTRERTRSRDSSLHLRVLSVLPVPSPLRPPPSLRSYSLSLSLSLLSRLDPRSPRISSVETFNPSSISAQSRARRRVGPCRVDERTRAYLAGGAARAPRVQLHRAAKAKQRVAQRRCHPSFLP